MFDLGNVIVKNNPLKACRKLSKNCPTDIDQVGWFAPKKMHRLIDTGKASSRQLYRIAVKKLGITMTQKLFEMIITDIFTPNKPVQQIAKRLSGKYKLLLLSNTNSLHHNHVKKNFPVLKLFTHHIVSYKVGSMKPGRKIYAEAVRKSGCSAGECVLIDDREENIAGARKAGMKAIQYTTPAKLRQSLKNLGVKI